MISLAIEYFRETDGLAKKQATVAVQALALQLIADRLEHGGPMSKPGRPLRKNPLWRRCFGWVTKALPGKAEQSGDERGARPGSHAVRRVVARFVPSPAISIVR